MGIIGEMTVRIAADTSSLMSGVGSATNMLQGLMNTVYSVPAVGPILAVAGAAALDLGAASLTAAADFQTSAAKIQAYAGLSAQATDAMKQSILDMSTQVGLKPKELSDALYPIVSSGYSASESLSILKLSAETAAASGAKTSVVADALTTSLKSMHAPANQASLYMDEINKMCSLGKGEIPQYANVIGKLSLSAGGAGVDFKTMGATLATLTTHGFPSVAQASTALGNLYTQIGPKVDNLTQHAKKLGLSFDENAFKTMSFGDKMDYLNKVTGGNQGEVLKLLGGNTLALKSFNALEGSTKDFTSNLQAMGQAQGTTASVFAVASQSYNFSLQKLGAALDVLKINVGNALLPVLTQLVNAFTPMVAGISNIASASSPLAPLFANVAGMFHVMATNWQESSGSFAPLLTTLVQFGTLIGQLLPGFITFFLLMMNNANSIIVSLAAAFATIGVPAIRIFGQVLQGAQQFLAPIINAVSNSLVPAIQGLVDAIAPVIAGFLSWVANSGLIVPIMSGLGTAVSIVVTVLSGLINGLTAVITFFTQTELGGTILKAILITLGIVIGIIAVVVLPGLIAGFVATAAAAIMTGISIALAFLPITLIVLGVIAVITLIILAVTHWGAIVAWLQAAWSAVVAFFVALWNAILAAVVSVGASIGGFLTGLWNGILNVAISFGQGFLDAITFPFRAVGALFVWLYQHNYYFQALVDTVMDLTRQVGAFLQSVWSAAVTFVVGLWNGAVGMAHAAWSSVTGAISNAVSIARGAIMVGFSAAATFLTGIWNGIVSSVTSAWQHISSIFSGAWNTYIATPLSNLQSSIAGFFSGLANLALSWGKNLIQGFIDGINNMAGAAGNAASGVVNNVKSMLGFHSPAKDGPGRDADTWAPNLMKMYVGGITRAIPDVHAAAMGVADQLSAMNGSANYHYTGKSSAMAMSAAGGNASGGEQHIHVHIGNDEVAHYVTDKQMKMVRLGGYRR